MLLMFLEPFSVKVTARSTLSMDSLQKQQFVMHCSCVRLRRTNSIGRNLINISITNSVCELLIVSVFTCSAILRKRLKVVKEIKLPKCLNLSFLVLNMLKEVKRPQ